MERIIYVVDDEQEIANLLKSILEKNGFKVKVFYDGTSFLDEVKRTEPDIVLLDVMLGDINGFNIVSRLRIKYFFPIIMLTALDADNDKITGLTFGADDYITKPFNIEEVLARINSHLRRNQNYNSFGLEASSNSVIEIRELIINNESRKVKLNGEIIPLTPIEYKILYYLARNKGIVVSSEDLFKVVWEEKFFNSNNTIMAHIARIREKIDNNKNHAKYIKTVWGVGYLIE
ncbi:response regulator transcription factor [Mycoplasma sp. P36-A1]|uniref:response regulator transcription factor n=1 Tax=Mycoplasma sp. P36-A1 TaxID=3252900 RepID=UPI003C2BB977